MTRELLNSYKNDPKAVSVHEAQAGPQHPTVYSRIDRTPVDFGHGDAMPVETFTFLTYHAVFRTSGLPAGLPWWQELLASLVASPADWH